PYVIYGGIRFYERAEIKDALSYLRMLVTQDDLSFKRIINTPKRGIGDTSVEKLLDYARENSLTMYQAAAKGFMPSKTQSKLDQFVRMIEDFRIRMKDMELEKVLQMVLDETGYRSMLELSSDPLDVERIENLKELISDIKDFSDNNPSATLDDYLQVIALYTDVQSDVNGKFVSLMTIHAAKGLEFDNVFIVGFSEGIFPSERSLADGLKGLEEERRLAYVACTRARKNLFLTDNLGYSFATSTAKRTSRFIKEIDEQYIEQVGLGGRISWGNGSQSVERRSDSAVSLSGGKKKYRPGDILVHDDFGEGVLISIEEGGKFGKIAFGFPYMTKTLALNFPKLHKKEGD
ncbi:MAG: ATP-binding domain-containing protein, partial [Erysipelotrichaceae bacterium]|nr:ATP-binding domain-containing protein [Erysipelotrichaceae bacterium]